MLRRIGFLPLFFCALGVAFAAIVALRLRSVWTPARTGAAAVGAANNDAAGAAASSRFGGPGTATAATGSVHPIATGESPDARVIAERERRYQQLLQASGNARAPARPAPAAQPAGFLSRIVSPIVKAFSPEEHRPAPVAQAARTNATAPHIDTGGNDQGKTTTDKDPNSDTTPPQLIALSFDPPVVPDGSETVMAVTATDDISGVRAISGNIVSPAGALEGFALDRQGDGTHWLARIAVPKDAAAGDWHVNFLTLSDSAGNTVTLSWRQGGLPGTAFFKVTSSSSDTTPPTLKAVWIDRSVVRAGEKDTLFVDADDDKSGVMIINGDFVSPARFAHLPFGCHQAEGTTWQCDIVAPINADCGDWVLEQLQLQDKANNIAIARAENNPIVAQVKMNVSSDSCDSTPPAVHSVQLDASVVSAPGSINVIVQATDDASGVQSISGQFLFSGPLTSSNQPPRLYFSCHQGGADAWIGTVTLPAKLARGPWRLTSLQATDKAGNLKVYADGDPVLSNATFRVQ